MTAIRHKRGSRADIDAAATASGLAEGEPYFVTDDGVPAIGLSATEYASIPVITGAKRFAVVTTMPDTPDPETVYFKKPA